MSGTAAAGGTGAAASPVRAVLSALSDGAPTLAAVRARTGLDASLVDAAVDHLVRTGRVGSARLPMCSAGGCGTCPAATTGAAGPGRGCAATAAGGAGGPATPDATGRTVLALWVIRR